MPVITSKEREMKKQDMAKAGFKSGKSFKRAEKKERCVMPQYRRVANQMILMPTKRKRANVPTPIIKSINE